VVEYNHSYNIMRYRCPWFLLRIRVDNFETIDIEMGCREFFATRQPYYNKSPYVILEWFNKLIAFKEEFNPALPL